MEELVMKCFQIISAVGAARSSFVEAMEAAREGNFEKADQKMQEGQELLVSGHTEHTGMVTQEAAGDHIEVNLFLVHAEDQLMSAETIKIMANELIHVYQSLREKNCQER